MKVYLRLYAFLAERVSGVLQERYPEGVRSGARLELELVEGSTLEDLVAQLALPPGLTKLTFVNGRMQDADYTLQPEDEVGVFPPIAGG
jgi:molybdopterin converting factor small subunit